MQTAGENFYNPADSRRPVRRYAERDDATAPRVHEPLMGKSARVEQTGDDHAEDNPFQWLSLLVSMMSILWRAGLP